MSKRSSVFMAAIALLSMASCNTNPSSTDSVTSAPVSEKGSEVSTKTMPDFTVTIAGQKHEGTPIVTSYSGAKVTLSYTCTSNGAVTEKWYKGKEELREAPKDIGDYSYYLAVDETATHKSASAQFPFTISALPLTFKGDFTKAYDGSEEMAIALTDKNSNVILGEDVTMNITFASALPGSDIAKVTLTGEHKDNYVLPDSVNASIVAANVATKPWSDSDDTTWIVYDGKPHSLEVEESDYYTVNGNNGATEPGDYPFTASLKPGYAWTDGTADSLTHHLKIRKEYNETMRAVVDSHETEFTEDRTDCFITIVGTESGKLSTGMQVTLIDDYGIVLGTATVGEMAKYETEEPVTEVGTDTTDKVMVLLDGINPSVIANNPTETYLISVRQEDYHWEPEIIKAPTTSSKGVAAFKADEDPNLKIFVDLPTLSADDYDIIIKTAAACTSPSVHVYDLKHGSAEDLIYRTAPSLYNDADHDYIKALQDLCEFEAEVPADPSNHAGASHYEWSTAAGGMPTYDILTNKYSTGKADKYCDDCNHIIASDDVRYIDGSWRKNTAGTYDRVYKGETLIGETGRDKWNVHLDTTGGTAWKGAFTDATPKATGLNNRTIRIVVSQYEKPGYTFDSITYYVDGASQGKITKSSRTPESSRVYYVAGATDPYFAIRTSTHIDEDLGLDEDFTGDVYVEINWTKDA